MMLESHYPALDAGSFQLGMIEAFCEMVAQEVKPLALSPIIAMAHWPRLSAASAAIAEHYGVSCYEETDLVSSDLAPDEEVKGQMVVLYYRDETVLGRYLALKKRVAALQHAGRYGDSEKTAASVDFRRLLGYSEDAINAHYQ